MTTPIAQSPGIEASREKLPPVERSAEAQTAPVAVEIPSVASPNASPKKPAYETPADPNDPPGEMAKSVARWVHKHPEAHKHGAGNLVYQYVRSFAASVPYGIQMALTLAAFTKMERVGQSIAENQSHGAGLQRFGRGLNAFAKFPAAKTAALVGTAFTLYRGTSKLMKWMTEYVFNPKDSEQRTAEKLHDLPEEAWRKIKEIAPAEAASTPVAAVVLGFIASAFQKPVEAMKAAGIDYTRDHFRSIKGLGNKLSAMGKVITHPAGKFTAHASIFTFGYALFFELGDRLFKDTQIRRGVWPGEHHSIKALKAAPDEYAKGIEAADLASHKKYEDSAVEAAPEKKHYGFFTAEPSVGRFVFRRLLPTAIGITAYTGAKFRWASMLGNDFTYKAGEPILRKIPKLALTEGLATSLFFVVPLVSEPWEKMYDKFWAKKEKVAQLKDHMRNHPDMVAERPTAHQVSKYDALLERVNAHEAAKEGQASAVPATIPGTQVGQVVLSQRVASNDAQFTHMANA
jgi:hypothetical protein